MDRIHEDTPIETDSQFEDKENKLRIPKKNPGGKRIGLQPLKNGIVQKNITGVLKENTKPQDTLHARNEDSKLDLLKTNTMIIKKRDKTSFSLSKDFLFPTELSEDIWKYYKETECVGLPKPDYMIGQPDINWKMRSLLVDWLVCVAEEYNLSEETLYLAVNYIDRFLSKISVVHGKLQLVGVTAMLIAGKMEEVHPPMPQEWTYLTNDTYTTRQILNMEKVLIKVLEFKLQPPTSYNFLRRFCADHDMDEGTTNLALYLSELIMLEGKHYLNYKPSELAAAAVLFARLYFMKGNIWPQEMEKSSGYSVKQLSPIVEAQNATLMNSARRKQQAIQDKYKSPKFGRVALLKPKCLELENLLEVENGGTDTVLENELTTEWRKKLTFID